MGMCVVGSGSRPKGVVISSWLAWVWVGDSNPSPTLVLMAVWADLHRSMGGEVGLPLLTPPEKGLLTCVSGVFYFHCRGGYLVPTVPHTE